MGGSPAPLEMNVSLHHRITITAIGTRDGVVVKLAHTALGSHLSRQPPLSAATSRHGWCLTPRASSASHKTLASTESSTRGRSQLEPRAGVKSSLAPTMVNRCITRRVEDQLQLGNYARKEASSPDTYRLKRSPGSRQIVTHQTRSTLVTS